jgi:hypothetical protein
VPDGGKKLPGDGRVTTISTARQKPDIGTSTSAVVDIKPSSEAGYTVPSLSDSPVGVKVLSPTLVDTEKSLQQQPSSLPPQKSTTIK